MGFWSPHGEDNRRGRETNRDLTRLATLKGVGRFLFILIAFLFFCVGATVFVRLSACCWLFLVVVVAAAVSVLVDQRPTFMVVLWCLPPAPLFTVAVFVRLRKASSIVAQQDFAAVQSSWPTDHFWRQVRKC